MNRSFSTMIAALCLGCLSGCQSSSDTTPKDSGGVDSQPVVEDCTDGWCTIPAGTFLRGARPGDDCIPAYSANRVEVTLTRSFVMLESEVTQAQWEAVGFSNPALDVDPDRPVTLVNWYEALAFCNALSQAEGFEPCYDLSCCTGELGTGCGGAGAGLCGDGFLCDCDETKGNSLFRYDDIYACPGYRLPTVAEWEYAARAGTTTSTYNGDHNSSLRTYCEPDEVINEIAWNCSNTPLKDSRRQVMPVRQLKKNGFGLYDMLGNASEWLSDPYTNVPYPGGVDPHGNIEISSGRARSTSSVFDGPGCCIPSWIGSLNPNTKSNLQGFRPVRTIFE